MPQASCSRKCNGRHHGKTLNSESGERQHQNAFNLFEYIVSAEMLMMAGSDFGSCFSLFSVVYPILVEKKPTP